MRTKHVGMAVLGGLAALQMNVLPAQATAEGEQNEQIRCAIEVFEKDLFHYKLFDCAGLTDDTVPNGIVDYILIQSAADTSGTDPLVILYNEEDGASIDTARRITIPRLGYIPLQKKLFEIFQAMFVNLQLLDKQEENLFKLDR